MFLKTPTEECDLLQSKSVTSRLKLISLSHGGSAACLVEVSNY